jgi:hypothetical protein
MKPINNDFLDSALGEGAVLLEPREKFDRAIIGVVARPTLEPIACYDIEKILDVLQGDGMTRQEAVEWFEYNTASTWFGIGTPVYLARGPG